jgi:hypothetical protein
MYFIMHGIDNSIPDEYIAFQKKYGISLKKESVLDPLSLKKPPRITKLSLII